MLKRNFLILIALLAIMTTSLTAQTDACVPPNPPGCPGWSNWTAISWTLEAPYCQISIEYRTRVCNGQYEVQYRNVVVSDNCGFMQGYNNKEISFSAITEMIDILLIEEYEDALGPPIIDCAFGTTTISKFYSASCGIWLSCEYDIVPQVPRCEQGYDGVPASGPTTVKTWKWQACGQTCCVRTYTVCTGNDPTTGNHRLFISNITRQKIGSCTDEPAPGGNGKYAKPCKGGC